MNLLVLKKKNCEGFLHTMYMSRDMRKPDFCIYAQLISAFVFPTYIEQSRFYLNPKFQVSSHLLWLFRPVCVGPGRNSRRLVFPQRGSYGHGRPLGYVTKTINTNCFLLPKEAPLKIGL